MMNLVRRLVGTKNDRELKRLVPYVERINQLEPALAKLSDAALAARTADFKQRIANGEPLESLIPETFATVREAMKRTIGKRHFDVQLLGGIVLHEGTIAEMKTGEGKTFVATLPCYLNALTGRGVHVVTVNDYLARRDAAWMGEIHNFLGLSVGCIVHDLSDLERKRAYAADITYGTNNEFGFDYLRDNMKASLEYCVQRELHYAIVDEVDSILIDEARTPLIISGPSRGQHRALPSGEPGDPAPRRRHEGRPQEREARERRLLGGRGAPPGHAHRGGRAQGRADPAHREPLRPAAAARAPRREPGADRAHAEEARRRLRGAAQRQERQAGGDHRRRVHGSADAWPPLVGRPAPGRRGEGRHPDPEREPDLRLDHLPELLPHVRQARRHDRHRRHRGPGVREDLRPRRDRGADQPADDPRATSRTSSTRASARSSTR